jgi:hypothetical protein
MGAFSMQEKPAVGFFKIGANLTIFIVEKCRKFEFQKKKYKTIHMLYFFKMNTRFKNPDEMSRLLY